MAFKEDKNWFNNFKKAVAWWLYDAVVDIVWQIKENYVPRSDFWPPKNPDAPVSGNLKDSLTRAKDDDLQYRVWIDAWHSWEWKTKPVEYWEYLEFWTRKMKPRPFLRNGAEYTKERFQQVFAKWFKARFN